MTDKLTDMDEDLSETQDTEIETEAELDDNDPMLAGLKEAEEEVAALEEEKAELEAETGIEAPKGEDEGKDEGEAKTEAADEETGDETSPMIPKPRFDQVLSERDLLRDQVGYMRGLLDANQQAPSGTQGSGDKTDQIPGADNQEGSEVDTIAAKIDEAEAKKLELAEKYDEGEISTVDLRKAEMALDKEVRGLLDQKDEAKRQELREESKAHTDAALSATQQVNLINDQALRIEQDHPNVAAIDQLPKATSDAVWATINDQAARNLASRGVNINDTSVQTRVTMIQEKAALTDQLTPENMTGLLMGQYQFVDPSQYKTPEGQGNGQTTETETGKGKDLEAIKNRREKIALANSQPPSIADMGNGTDTGELTEADIVNMTQDQLADIMEKAPQRIQRILGNSAT